MFTSEIRAGSEVAKTAFDSTIHMWKRTANSRIFDYGTITVGNNAASVAAAGISWIPIFGPITMSGQVIAHAACGPETETRRQAVVQHFNIAGEIFNNMDGIGGSSFILACVGNLPQDSLYIDAGKAVLGLVKLLSKVGEHVTSKMVEETMEQLSEISPRLRPNFSPWKQTDAKFYVDLDRVARAASNAQLCAALSYLGRGVVLSSLLWLSRSVGITRTCHEFSVQFAPILINELIALGAILSVAALVMNAMALSDAIKTRDELYDKANETERQLYVVAREYVEVIRSLELD